MGGGKVQFTVVRVAVTRPNGADLRVAVTATARTLRPLYSKVDAAEYMRATFKLDQESTADARRLMADREASQTPEFARLRPFPPDPYRALILRMTAGSGAAFAYQAVLRAHREGDSWNFTLESGAYDSGFPMGEGRSAFGDGAFLAGDPGDDARLRALAADLKAFAERVAETRRNMEAAHAGAVAVRREAFLARISPGSVFRGVALRAGEQQGVPLYLEITGFSAGNAVTALLRNGGGWHYGRAFQGTWSSDADFEAPTLDLASQPEQAVRNAGPFLENSQGWSFSLRMDPKGNLWETSRSYQYRFEYVNAGQLPSLRAGLAAEFERAMSATAPGSLYRGAAVSKATGASEPLLLRFKARSQDGESLEAAIESTTRQWKRPLHGSIIGNSRRSGGEPVRLRSTSGEAAEEAGAGSILGDRNALDVHLGVEGGTLAGEDGRFTYRFAPLEAGDLASLDAARAARARRFSGALRDGIAYDGTIRDDQGSVTQARLEIAHIDRQKGTIAASIHSLVQLNVYQELSGTWNPPDVSMTLGTTGVGEFDSSDSLAVPFLVAPVAHTLQLALVGDSITGGIQGDPHWEMEFPVGVFLSAPAEGLEPDSPPADASVFPSFPGKTGAYLLSGGTWRPLPRNNGHVVVETIHPMTPEEASGGALGAVASGVRRLAQKGVKVAYLEFDGKDPRPEADGRVVILLFIGPPLPRTPPLELTSAETLKDGRRGVEVAGGSPTAIWFGEQRVAAYVRPVGPGAVLLTTTSPLPAGSYVLNADVGYELSIGR